MNVPRFIVSNFAKNDLIFVLYCFHICHFCQREFPNVINWNDSFPFIGMLGGNFTCIQILKCLRANSGDSGQTLRIEASCLGL